MGARWGRRSWGEGFEIQGRWGGGGWGREGILLGPGEIVREAGWWSCRIRGERSLPDRGVGGGRGAILCSCVILRQ